MPSYAKKRDANHNECVDEFRRLGCSVLDLASLGKGVPDLLVGLAGYDTFPGDRVNLLVEIKDGPKAKLTGKQPVWHSEWKGHVCIVRDLEDVRNLVKIYTR